MAVGHTVLAYKVGHGVTVVQRGGEGKRVQVVVAIDHPSYIGTGLQPCVLRFRVKAPTLQLCLAAINRAGRGGQEVLKVQVADGQVGFVGIGLQVIASFQLNHCLRLTGGQAGSVAGAVGSHVARNAHTWRQIKA